MNWLLDLVRWLTGTKELLTIVNQIKERQATHMAATDDIKEFLDEVGTNIANISGDTRRLLAKIDELIGSSNPAEAAKLAAIREQALALRDKTKALADSVPDDKP